MLIQAPHEDDYEDFIHSLRDACPVVRKAKAQSAPTLIDARCPGAVAAHGRGCGARRLKFQRLTSTSDSGGRTWVHGVGAEQAPPDPQNKRHQRHGDGLQFAVEDGNAAGAEQLAVPQNLAELGVLNGSKEGGGADEAPTESYPLQ